MWAPLPPSLPPQEKVTISSTYLQGACLAWGLLPSPHSGAERDGGLCQQQPRPPRCLSSTSAELGKPVTERVVSSGSMDVSWFCVTRSDLRS